MYIYIYKEDFFYFIFPTRVPPRSVRPRGEGTREIDVKPMSRFNLLDITAVSIEYRRGCVTNTGWSRKWLRRYIYIRFQWTTGCIEEEIVIVSDRSDRKLVSNASDASCARETEWQWTISAFEDSLSQLSWLAKRDNDSFPPAIRRVLFFFKLEREEVIKKRLYSWDKIKPSVYTIAIISFFSTIFKQKFIKSIEFSEREKVFDRRVLHLDTIKLII